MFSAVYHVGPFGIFKTNENFRMRACMFFALIHYHFLPGKLSGPGNPK